MLIATILKAKDLPLLPEFLFELWSVWGIATRAVKALASSINSKHDPLFSVKYGKANHEAAMIPYRAAKI